MNAPEVTQVDTLGQPAGKGRGSTDPGALDCVAAMPIFANVPKSWPVSAKQFRIIEIDMRTACELNKRWHSMLPRTDLGNMLCGNTSAAYAAEFEGFYYAVGIWSQPIIRANCDGSTIELRRLAIGSSAPKNTASRMIAIIWMMVRRKYPQIKKGISYLAIDVHVGTIYRAAGWKAVGDVVAARPQRLRGCKQRATGPLQTTSRKQRWEIT